MTDKDERPPIPDPLKRKVRQQCFFGCVLCGAPVFHYDHIEEYSEVQEHTLENLALLCERHHGAKTTGKLSAERVREARDAPFNRDRILSSGWQQEASRSIDINVGTNIARCDLNQENPIHRVIWNTGKTYLALHWDSGWYSITTLLTDQTGRPLLFINQGELKIFSRDLWDYMYEGTTLQVRAGLGIIALDLSWSDTEFALRRGCYMDRFGNGFIAHHEGLAQYLGGNVVGWIAKSQAVANAFGAFGLNNSKYFPREDVPGGFGFFQGG